MATKYEATAEEVEIILANSASVLDQSGGQIYLGKTALRDFMTSQPDCVAYLTTGRKPPGSDKAVTNLYRKAVNALCELRAEALKSTTLTTQQIAKLAALEAKSQALVVPKRTKPIPFAQAVPPEEEPQKAEPPQPEVPPVSSFTMPWGLAPPGGLFGKAFRSLYIFIAYILVFWIGSLLAFVLTHPEVLVDCASAVLWFLPEYLSYAAQRILNRVHTRTKAFFRNAFSAGYPGLEYIAPEGANLNDDTSIASMALGGALLWFVRFARPPQPRPI